jgi:micrococcal nuclease
MTYYFKASLSMEYIFTQISLGFSAILLSLGVLFGVPIDALIQTDGLTSTTTALVTKVIDGDTIDVVIDGATKTTRVRYIGVDTPEPYANEIPECGSLEATTRNTELVNGQTVIIAPGADPYDKYDRLLAYVYVGDIFVNEVLLGEGYATVLMIEPNTYYQNKFNELYKRARLEKRGIWALCE